MRSSDLLHDRRTFRPPDLSDGPSDSTSGDPAPPSPPRRSPLSHILAIFPAQIYDIGTSSPLLPRSRPSHRLTGPPPSTAQDPTSINRRLEPPTNLQRD